MPASTFEIETTRKAELVDITRKVNTIVRASGISDGIAHVYCPHTTAGVIIQENADPDVQHDLLLALENAVPVTATRGKYKHGEGNSDAHVKAALVGTSQTVPFEKGALVLGTWQAIYLCEFDGPRGRRVYVRLLS